MRLIFITLLLLLPMTMFCQKFSSDSVCYKNIYTGEFVKCDTSDHWNIERNGDYIKAIHLLNKNIGLLTTIRIEYQTEEKSGYLVNSGFKSSSEVYECNASDNTKTYPLGIVWQLLDFNDDGTWDQLKFSWMENNSHLMRIIYCSIDQ